MVETQGIRVHKVLSQAGIASRRAAEKLIIDGRV
ncbi:MAG: rRNA synthase, partial [Mycobacterium sp.]|nr:rRNA synthase [Mycobacterium sp.]